MRKFRILLSLVAFVMLVGSLSGCDNRSQFEKDVDKTAGKVKDVFK